MRGSKVLAVVCNSGRLIFRVLGPIVELGPCAALPAMNLHGPFDEAGGPRGILPAERGTILSGIKRLTYGKIGHI